jgi:hypothetical protein
MVAEMYMESADSHFARNETFIFVERGIERLEASLPYFHVEGIPSRQCNTPSAENRLFSGWRRARDGGFQRFRINIETSDT